jgi:hypothetical protein
MGKKPGSRIKNPNMVGKRPNMGEKRPIFYPDPRNRKKEVVFFLWAATLQHSCNTTQNTQSTTPQNTPQRTLDS